MVPPVIRASDGGPPTAFVLLSHGLDAVAYRQAFERGEVPDESPYGFHLAEEFGWRLIFSRDRPDGPIRKVVRGSMRRLLGFDLLQAWTNRGRMRSADIIWTMTENEWLAARCLGLLRRTSTLR